jgi:glycogen synthase
LISRFVWQTYQRLLASPISAPIVRWARADVRKIFFPEGIEAGLFGFHRKSIVPAHYPHVKPFQDPHLAEIIRSCDTSERPQLLSPLQNLTRPVRFSVIINTLNRSGPLKNALLGLAAQRWPLFEVIVVNGPSTDDTKETLALWEGRIVVARCDVANLSISRNIGIALATGDVVCFLDDDAVPEPDWLDVLAAAYDQSDWASVGGAVRDHTGVTFQCRGLAIDRLARERHLPDNAIAKFEQAPQAPETLSTTGCNSSFRLDALRAIGGFDTTYAYFLDESDINLRLMDAGLRQTFALDAQVHHHYQASSLRDADHVPKNLLPVATSLAYFCVRHGLGVYGPEAIINRLEAYRQRERQLLAGMKEQGRLEQAEIDGLEKNLLFGLRLGAQAAKGPQLRRSASVTALRKPADFNQFVRENDVKRRLRIALLSGESPYGAQNGIAVWTKSLATALAEKGHEVSIICNSTTGRITVEFMNGIWVHSVVATDAKPPAEFKGLPLHLWRASDAKMQEVERIAAGKGLDFISAPIWDLEPLALVNNCQIPWSMSLHTTYKLANYFKPEWQGKAGFAQTSLAAIARAETYLLASAPSMIANSETILKALEDEYAILLSSNRVTIVPHGSDDLELVHCQSSDTKVKTSRVIFWGRLEARKGGDLILDVIQTMVRTHVNLEFVIIGQSDIPLLSNGQTFDEAFSALALSAQQCARIIKMGPRPREELVGWIKSADIILLPSRFESFGLVYAEAASLRKPIVALNIPAAREVLGEAGLFCDHTAADLIYAINRLLLDASLGHRLGESARQRFDKNMSRDTMAVRIERHITETIVRQRSQT